MTRISYLYKGFNAELPYAVCMGVGRVYNCNCNRRRNDGFHNRNCASWNNLTLKYEMTWLERLKSLFVDAGDIHSFSEYHANTTPNSKLAPGDSKGQEDTGA